MVMVGVTIPKTNDLVSLEILAGDTVVLLRCDVVDENGKGMEKRKSKGRKRKNPAQLFGSDR